MEQVTLSTNGYSDCLSTETQTSRYSVYSKDQKLSARDRRDLSKDLELNSV